MSTAFSLLLVCIVLASGSAIHDSTAARSLIEALAVVALAFVGIGVSGRAIDVKVAARCTQGLKVAAAIPAILMIIQLLPLPAGGHSIWIYASEALGRRSWGHITIDLGKTVLALAYYLANISLIVVSVFVTRQRRRAELLLFALTSIASLTTLGLLISRLGPNADPSNNYSLSGISALGILFALASIAQAVESFGADGQEPEARNGRTALIAGGVGLIIAAIGLSAGATLNVILTLIFAVLIFGSVEALRRIGLARWAAAVLLVTIVTAAAMVILWRYDSTRAISPFLQFATASSPDAISVTQRLLSDTPWLGVGAGTLAVALPIYQDIGTSVTLPPSTISALAIELGWPMTLFVMLAVIWLCGLLYRGALNRGRDAVYPAAAAGGTVILLGQTFCDASLLNVCVAVFASSLIGLGLAQSVSGRENA